MTPKQPLRVLQISDTHLVANPAQPLMGLNTERCFDATLELLRAHPQPADLVLVTGDLTHDGSHGGYQRLGSKLATLGIPAYCLPGNHDDPQQMRQTLNSGPVQALLQARHGSWAFLLLDSTQPGMVGGRLDKPELEQLEQTLEQNADHHCLVCLHHQPVPVGSKWLDALGLENADDLFEVLDRHPQVQGLVWGHVHQVYDQERNGIRLLACPSTNAQFLPGAEKFAEDILTPGYRWLELYPDGRIETGVERMAVHPDVPHGSSDQA